MTQTIILCVLGLLIWIWLMGYLNAIFFVKDFKNEESFLFLEANACAFIESNRIKHSSNLNSKNKQSILLKIFSINADYTLIGKSKLDNEIKIFRATLKKTWIPFNIKRELNIVEESDKEIISEITQNKNVAQHHV
jgi:hypothetical protein